MKALKKKNPHGFGILKYFCYFVIYFKDLKADEIHANYLKSLHGKYRVCQQQSDVLEEK